MNGTTIPKALACLRTCCTSITEEFTSDDYEEQYGEGAIRLFQVSPDGRVAVCVAGSTKSVEPGTTLVSLVYED